METRWSNRYAQRTHTMEASIIRELLKLTTHPDIISFAGGLPAPDVFPVHEFEEACSRVLREHGEQALQYSTTEGHLPLREMIARHSVRYGINVGPENILITSGSQQALDLIGKVFINSGDNILIEHPTYLGALQAWGTYQAEYIPIPLDDQGMCVEQVAEALRAGSKFIYALPNFHNPAGVTLSLERRKKLIEIASREGVPIVEDDPYGQLRYQGDHLPPLAALDSETPSKSGYSGNVIYLSTFSKILAPGIRLGWVIAAPSVIQKLVLAKQGTDLHSSTFDQMVAYEVAKGGFLDQHIQRIRRAYGERLQVMLSALEEYFPGEIEWTEPKGGLFLWATLPKPFDTREILKIAIQERVAFVPGGAFYSDGSGWNSMRLNFSYCAPDLIVEGIRRLGNVLEHVFV